MPRSTPDYFPIQVMNTILGGSFSSRLNMNLREKHGYTYGATSSFDMRVEPGPFVAAAGVQTDKTAEALKEFFNELNGDSAAGAGRRADAREELRRAAVSRRVRDDRRHLAPARGALVYHLPDDYFSKYVPNIEAVTAADVQRVAREVHPARRFAGRGRRRSQGRSSRASARSTSGRSSRSTIDEVRRAVSFFSSQSRQLRNWTCPAAMSPARHYRPGRIPGKADRVQVAEHRRVRRQQRRVQEIRVERVVSSGAP